MQAAIKRTQEDKKEIWEVTASLGVALESCLFCSSSGFIRTGQHFLRKGKNKEQHRRFFVIDKLFWDFLL